MRIRVLLAVLAGLLLLVSACDDTEPDADTPEGDEAEAEADLEDLEDELGGLDDEMPEPVELDDGVAATLDGEEIADTDVDERFDPVSEIPEIAEQLEGDDSVEVLLRSEILNHLVEERLINMAADELGVEATDEQLAEVEERVVADSGGEDELAATLEEQGVTDEQYDEALRIEALVEAMRDYFADEATDEEVAEAEQLQEQTGQEIEAADLAMGEWYGDFVAAMDVQVDAAYGTWDPGQGRIMPPPEAMPDMPPAGELEDLEEDLEGLGDE